MKGYIIRSWAVPVAILAIIAGIITLFSCGRVTLKDEPLNDFIYYASQEGLPVSFRDKQDKEHPYSFNHNLRQLTDRGVIAQEDAALWKQAGELREWASLPKHDTVVGPDHAATALSRAATLLNRLFA